MTVSNGNQTTEPTASPKRPRALVIGAIAGAVLLGLVLALYLLPVPVNGQITDASSRQPLADAKITLSTGEEIRSDAQGHFAARASRFQPLSVSVDEASYQPWQGEPAFGMLPLTPATLSANLDPSVLQGLVVNALDNQPVAGATVTSGDQTVTTDSEGRFEMCGLSRWGSMLTLVADKYISFEQPVANWPADGASPITLQLYPDGLHGVITDATTGQPLAAAAAVLNGQSSASLDNGFFYFPSAVGTGQISVTVPGYQPVTLEIASGAALQGQEAVDIALEPTVLRGTVTDGQTGESLAGVVVKVGDQTTTTDKSGAYRIARLHGQDLRLAGELDGYVPLEQAVDEAANLLGGKPLDLVLMPPHLAGQLVNEVTGSPVVSATVTAGDLSAITDGDGRFILWTDETPLDIAVDAIGYEPARATFAEDAGLSMALKPKGVVIRTQDKSGKPLAGVTIAGPRSEATTDAQGIALLPLLEPGEAFTATVENFAPVSQPYDGKPQQELTLAPNTIAGRALDAQTGEPVPGAVIYAYDKVACQGEACRGTEPVVLVDAAADGTFKATGLPADAQIMVKAPGYSLFFPETFDSETCEAPYCLTAKMEPFEARGFYVPFHYLYDRALIESRLDLIQQSPELNAVVVDMKSDYGKLAWEPQNPIAKEIGVFVPDVMTAQEFLQEAKKRGVYTIARFVTFKDNALAEGRPEWALAKKSSPDVLWKDGENLAWVDPYRAEVREYEIDLAKELSALGFDEIQFDYFRFTGQTNHNQFTYSVESTPENRREAISSFSRELMEALKPYGIFTAIDVFGSIILNGNEPYIGQNLADMAKGLDYLSPMIYPQVWWPGTFPGCDEPVLCPYKVIYDSTATVRDIVPMPTRIRPWIQGYPNNFRTEGPARGYNYDVPEMMIQRQAADDAGAEGWLFWSGGGKFPDEIFGPMPSLAELEAQVRARQGGRSGPY